MAWPIGAMVLKTAGSLAAGYLQKPRKRDYRPDLSYLDKYVANLRGDLAKRSVERNIIREGGRQIGDITREGMERAEYQAHRTGTVGSGLHIAQQQKIGQQAQAGMAHVTRQARDATAEQAQRGEEAIRQAELHREQVVSQAKADYDAAAGRWKRDMWGRTITAGADIGAGIMQRQAEWKDASAVAGAHMPEQAIGAMEGIPEGFHRPEALTAPATAEQARQALISTGASTPQAALQALGISMEREQSRNFLGQMAELYNVTNWQYNPSLSPQQNAQMLESSKEFRFNMAQEELFKEAYQHNLGPGEVFEHVVSHPEFEQLSFPEKIQIKNNLVQHLGQMRQHRVDETITDVYGQMAGDVVPEQFSQQLSQLVDENAWKEIVGLMKSMPTQLDAITDEMRNGLETEIAQGLRSGAISSEHDALNQLLNQPTVAGRTIAEVLGPTATNRIYGHRKKAEDRRIQAMHLKNVRRAARSEIRGLQRGISDKIQEMQANLTREDHIRELQVYDTEFTQRMDVVASHVEAGNITENMDLIYTYIEEAVAELPNEVINQLLADQGFMSQIMFSQHGLRTPYEQQQLMTQLATYRPRKQLRIMLQTFIEDLAREDIRAGSPGLPPVDFGNFEFEEE